MVEDVLSEHLLLGKYEPGTTIVVDRDPAAISRMRSLAAELAPALAPENFQVGELDHLPEQGPARVVLRQGIVAVRDIANRVAARERCRVRTAEPT